MRIVQIAPDIGPGSGVAGVAYHLERELGRRGIQTARFTMDDARGGWLPDGRSGVQGRLIHAARVVWFSTVGTLLARSYLRRHPGSISICHNDALVGDVYVNHGILTEAMRARGRYAMRMVRNPLHLFTLVRDQRRYGRRGPHRLVVSLTTTDDHSLRRLHPRLRTPTAVIGNGVDLERFVPPSSDQRESARRQLGLAADDVAVLFVGHEFERKGLPVLLAALAGLPSRFKVVVVGGTPGMITDARGVAAGCGVADRAFFVGRLDDPRPCLRGCDVLALPSAYEAYPLVVLEALACGLPVVGSPTGSVPDLVVDARNGFVVPVEVGALRAAMVQVAGLLGDELSRECRRSAERHSWSSVAEDYLRVLASLPASQPAASGNR